jgi:hypothetical protein
VQKNNPRIFIPQRLVGQDQFARQDNFVVREADLAPSRQPGGRFVAGQPESSVDFTFLENTR